MGRFYDDPVFEQDLSEDEVALAPWENYTQYGGLLDSWKDEHKDPFVNYINYNDPKLDKKKYPLLAIPLDLKAVDERNRKNWLAKKEMYALKQQQLRQQRLQQFEKAAPYISEGLNTASGLLDSGKGQQGRSGISNAFGQFGQIGGKAGKAFQGLQMATAIGNFSDSMVTAIGGTSKSDQDSAWSKIPFATTFATALGGTASKYTGVNNHQGIDSGFAGVNNKINEAKYRSGSHFGIGKANAAVENATRMNRDLNAIQMQTDMATNNQAGRLYADNLSQQYYGYQPNLLTTTFAKTGVKLPTVQECRERLARAMKFKEGGKLEPNVIPEGALHKNKHHIEEANEELEGQITKKGIPVISYTKDGEVEQHAEIEKNEITFSKPVTEQIEKYYKEYEESQSDEAAIECGKFLVEQILHNTIDNTGLLKEVK